MATTNSVLLIDDEKPLLEVFVAALTPDFEAVTATTVREGEEILRQGALKSWCPTTSCPEATA